MEGRAGERLLVSTFGCSNFHVRPRANVTYHWFNVATFNGQPTWLIPSKQVRYAYTADVSHR